MNKTTEALKLAEKALLQTNPHNETQYKALAAIREALADSTVKESLTVAEPVKQEPVAWRCVIPRRTWTLGIDWGREYFEDESEIVGLQGVEPLYAAPLDAKAIRAEALEEAAKLMLALDLCGEEGKAAAAIKRLK